MGRDAQARMKTTQVRCYSTAASAGEREREREREEILVLALGSLKDPVRPSPLRTSIRYGRTFPLLLFETCGCFRSTANFVHQTLSMMTALFPPSIIGFDYLTNHY